MELIILYIMIGITSLIVIKMLFNTIINIFSIIINKEGPVFDIVEPDSLKSIIETINEMEFDDEDRSRMISEAITSYGQIYNQYYQKVVEAKINNMRDTIHDRLDVIQQENN